MTYAILAKENNMLKTTAFRSHALVLMLAGALMSGPVLADKPSWAGGKGNNGQQDKGKGKGKAAPQSSQRSEVRIQSHFIDRHRTVVRDYYVQEYRTGFCPPGLAKKNNGCMPPGQAKKWRVGHPLPRDVIFYDLPPRLVVELGPPPAGHRFVRVAADILLIAIGTGMVIDAVQDLGRM
jgi:Ni/Co efflux regulator RcnB